jgi:hypothetical protein
MRRFGYASNIGRRQFQDNHKFRKFRKFENDLNLKMFVLICRVCDFYGSEVSYCGLLDF